MLRLIEGSWVLFFNTKKFSKNTLHKKVSLPLRVSSVNVTRSARNCGFGHITKEICNGKHYFLWNDNKWTKKTGVCSALSKICNGDFCENS